MNTAFTVWGYVTHSGLLKIAKRSRCSGKTISIDWRPLILPIATCRYDRRFGINGPHRNPGAIAPSLFNRPHLASPSRTWCQALSKLMNLFRFQAIVVGTFTARPQQFVFRRQQPIGGYISNCSGLLNSRMLSPPESAGQKISPRHVGNLRRFSVRP